jgi:DnaK suppressor protein
MKTPDLISPLPVDSPCLDPKWTWHRKTLLALRQEVLHAQAEHKRTATAPGETTGIDFAESAQDESEHTVVLAELLAESDRLTEIDAALERLRLGTYGRCERTGEPISAPRLRAIPWTRFSRGAAEK